MFFSIDRVEAGLAVCETEEGTFLRIPLYRLPKGAKEGCVVRMENGVYSLDFEEAQRRRREALALQKELFGES